MKTNRYLKLIFLLPSLLMIFSIAHAQTPLIDSLKLALENTHTDTIEVWLLNKLTEELFKIDNMESLKHADLAYSKSQG